MSVAATQVTQPKGGQFVLHAKVLHRNPYDGHTLGPVIAEMEKLTGVEVRCIHVDKGFPAITIRNHAGNIPNIFAAGDGTAKVHVFNSKIALGGGSA